MDRIIEPNLVDYNEITASAYKNSKIVDDVYSTNN